MSIELYVHTSSDALLSPDDLISEAVSIEWDLALVKDLESMAPADFPGTCTIVGWERAGAEPPPVRDALATRDQAQLDALYREEVFALVQLSVEKPLAPDEEELRDLEEHGVDPGHLLRLREASTRYTLTTSASRNELSEELQTHVWVLLGVLTDGLCEDPQEGRFISAADVADDTE